MTLSCSKCGQVSLGEYSQSNSTMNGSNPEYKQRAQQSAAPHISIQRHPSGTLIQFKSRSSLRWFLLFFSLVWNAFMVVFIFGTTKRTDFSFVVIPHLIAGLGIAYTTLGMFLNTTTLLISRGKINVNIGPIPWPGKTELNSADLTQVTIEEYVAYTSGGKNSRGGTPVYAMQLVAHLNNGRKTVLIKGIYDYVEAVKIEQTIEATLAIQDKPETDQIRKQV